MAGIIISDVKALPRDIDVTVNVSKPQAETATDFSILCFCTTEGSFDHDGTRIRYYMSLDAVQADFAASSEAVRAATDFFSQAPRAKTLAIAKIFTTPQAGFLQGGVLGTTNLADWKAVTTGAFKITIDGTTEEITSLTFANITDLAGIAGVIQAGIRGKTSAGTGFTGAIVTFNETTNQIRITSGSTGETSTVSKLMAPTTASVVDISGASFLNAAQTEGDIQPAYVVPGYTPEGLASELNYIKEAAMANSKFVYAWALEKQYRDSNDAIAAAAWAEAQTAAMLGLVVNSPMAYSASSVTDVGYLCKKNGYHRTFVVYHDNPYYYPEVAILSYALHVNYAGINTTITTKFKDLFGIPTVPMDTTMLGVLNGKRINTFTLVGNSSRTFREGVDSNNSWFMDDLLNLDNFREELQVAVYNVFLQNKKVPYNSNGVTMLRNAMVKICDRYVKNGALSEREMTEAEQAATGMEVDPAYTITFTDIADMTVSDRAQRIGPPCHIKLNLAGAIHSLEINVEAFA